MLLAAAFEDWGSAGIDYIRVLTSHLATPQAVGGLALDAVMPVVDELALSRHG